jgi:S-DNA-T family DNA segregation ATPase FtsK/SpoIIIE
VGILRPDGETQAGADVLALTVRTYYLPNPDWQTLCQRGRALREAAGTLTGHAAGHDTAPVLDHAAVAKAIGAATPAPDHATEVVELPEPLAAVVDYLGEDLDAHDGREFVPSAELAEALDLDTTELGLLMRELGCRPTRERIPTDEGTLRQIRGYLTAEIRAAIHAAGTGQPATAAPEVDADDQ